MRHLSSGFISNNRLTGTLKKRRHDRKSSERLHADNGFTLIEIMIALAVLLMGMLGVMSMQYYAITGNTTSREMRMATNQTQQLVEQILSTPYADLSSSTDQPLLGVTETSLTGGQADITRTWWIVSDCVALSLQNDDNTCDTNLVATCCSDPDPTIVTQISAVRARTCWFDKNGNNHSMTIDTLRMD